MLPGCYFTYFTYVVRVGVCEASRSTLSSSGRRAGFLRRHRLSTEGGCAGRRGAGGNCREASLTGAD